MTDTEQLLQDLRSELIGIVYTSRDNAERRVDRAIRLAVSRYEAVCIERDELRERLADDDDPYGPVTDGELDAALEQLSPRDREIIHVATTDGLHGCQG